MATTSVWSIENKLKTAINYIANPEKTSNNEYGKNDNYNCLHIKENDFDFKNEKAYYVSGINCTAHTAYDEMMITKKRYGKEKGILAFHGYQSFKEGEVTPDIAHEIGVKLVEEIWGNNFEVVVATHQNTNHIHNHFIVNSVSFKDGKKYNNNKSNYALIRQLSDSLCGEYGLIVLNEDIKYDNIFQKRIQSDEYYKIVKEDIDNIIDESLVMQQLLTKLKQLGYNYYFKYNKLTVWKENQSKIRVEKVFGKDYSTERIKKRFENSKYRPYKHIPASEIYNNYLSKNKAHKGIYGLYLYYCYLLKVFPTEYPKQRLPQAIRKDIRIMDRISDETIFMTNNKIETYEDLTNFKNSNNEELDLLKNKRENLWKKYRRAKTEDIKVNVYNEISELQPRIKELQKYNRYSNEIEERFNSIQTNITEFNSNEVQKVNTKYRG